MTNEDKERIEKDALYYAHKNSPGCRGYVAGATAEHNLLKPQLEYADNYIRMMTEDRDRQLKQERNKAIDIYKQALHMLNDYANTGIADREYRNSLRDLIYKIKSELTAHGEY